MKTALFVGLALVGFVYLVALGRAVLRSSRNQEVLETLIGFVTNFFDTLGIGSFASTTAAFKMFGLVPDEKIPGTLNVGHTLPTIVQAFIYIAIVQVDVWTLVLMIAASVLGSWLGAGVVAGWPRRKIQIGMSIALIVAAGLFVRQIYLGDPTGGQTLRLEGWRLAVGLIGNFVLGALMELGIGLYGPCMLLVSLLGMNSKAAFPIMMGSCAFLMPVGSLKFIQRESYDLRAALRLGLGGMPAVPIAAFILNKLDIGTVRWLVVFVVLLAAALMLRSAVLEGPQKAESASA